MPENIIEFMENTITHMIKNYKNCSFKKCDDSIMLVRCIGKNDKLIHNFKGFYHFYFDKKIIDSMYWNKRKRKWIYTVINL